MKNNHHNQNCNLAEEIVSYIYDELGAENKSVFERHLINCESCADEVGNLGELSFSIRDWRDVEFSSLQTPKIVIPYETAHISEAVENTSVSWFAGLRQMFSLSPTWTLATASMAALVICAGLIFAVFKFSPTNEVAENDKNNDKNSIKVAVSPTIEKIVDAPVKVNNLEKTQSESPKNSSTINVKPEVAEVKPTTEKPLKNVVKVSESPANKTMAQPAVANKPKNSSETKKPVKNQNVPNLNNFDDEEDDSLRLADLFAEIETRR